jgi:hypothetical protein
MAAQGERGAVLDNEASSMQATLGLFRIGAGPSLRLGGAFESAARDMMLAGDYKPLVD